MHKRMARLLLRRGDNVVWHGERGSFFGRRHLDCLQKMEIDLRRPALGADEKNSAADCLRRIGWSLSFPNFA